MQVASSRSVARTLLGAALVVVLVALTLAAPAGAATYETSVSPDPFSYPETERLVYRLHITTGSQPERVQVSARPPSFPPSGRVVGAGQALAVNEMTLEGPGTVVQGYTHATIVDRFCVPVLPDFHGGINDWRSFIEVDLPANSASAVAFSTRPYSGTGSAPWLGMDLAAEFTVGQHSQPAQMVSSPSPANSGRHGVRISFHTDPEGTPGGCPTTFTPVDFGADILMSGRADTAVAGQLMTIRAVRSEPAGGGFGNRTPVWGPVELARVKVAEDGTFAYRWRPPEPGDYTLGALYQSQSPKFAEDFSIPTNVRVVQPPTTDPSPSDPPPFPVCPSPQFPGPIYCPPNSLPGIRIHGPATTAHPAGCAQRGLLRIGTNGNDTLGGSPSSDVLAGLGGNDVLIALGAPDCLYGGDGRDGLSGGAGNDMLSGASGSDRLNGGAGNDRLDGQSGSDRLHGGSAADRISGASGRDRLSGGSGRDGISGGPDADRISGGSGRDRLRGGSGNDRISARDGTRDNLNCGAGTNDRATVDAEDAASSTCETVNVG
jgi:RTX calcium-binding nonapeptide repeat (4 copies)